MQITSHSVKWMLPLSVVSVSLILFIGLVMFSADIGEIAFLFFLFPATALFLLAFAYHHRGRTAALWVLVAIMYVGISWHFARRPLLVRAEVRWILRSNMYKAGVLKQPQPLDGTLRHIEWDGTGFAGVANNTVYLVYDPDDLLAIQVKEHASGTFRGIPCEVWQIHRMASHWYYVQPYTDEWWQ